MNSRIFPFRAKEQIIRGVALQVFTLSVIAVFTQSIIPVIILVADFSLRSMINPNFSPLVHISKRIVPITNFRKRTVAFKPKRFAAFIGLFMSLTILLLLLTSNFIAATVFMIVLSSFSFLEAFFKFCAGCKIFGLLMKAGIISEDECVDCVIPGGDGI